VESGRKHVECRVNSFVVVGIECVMNSFQKVSSNFKTIELRTKVSFEVVEE